MRRGIKSSWERKQRIVAQVKEKESKSKDTKISDGEVNNTEKKRLQQKTPSTGTIKSSFFS
jgi:hypothetical protein